MKRRETITAVSTSLLAGTALSTASSADERRNGAPRVVSVETEQSDKGTSDVYTVDYRGDGRVEITGHVTAPNPCHEIDVADITATKHGDVVDLELVRTGTDLCITVIAHLRYTVELEYPDEDAVRDVLVRVPDGAGASRGP